MSSYKDYKKRALQNPEVKSEYDALNLNLIKVRKPLIKASVTSYLPYQKGVCFKTYSGLPFTYEIRKGRNGQYTKELWIDRPKALGDIRGVIPAMINKKPVACIPRKQIHWFSVS